MNISPHFTPHPSASSGDNHPEEIPRMEYSNVPQLDISPQVLGKLQLYGLKGRGTKFHCNSPFRPGSNSMAFSVTISPEWGGGGCWKDHVSGETGNFITLAPVLGIDLPKSASGEGKSILKTYNTRADYAADHGGLADEVFAAAGWSEVKPVWCSMHKIKRPAMVFSTRTGERVRFVDGLAPKYRHLKGGYHKCWYGLERALSIIKAKAVDKPYPLVLCNGEASVVAAQHYGVPAVTLGGGAEQTNGLPVELLHELLESHDGSFLIALDCDNTGRASAQAAAAQLRGAGHEVWAVDLNGHAGFDLANFVHLHEHCSMETLLTQKVLASEIGSAVGEVDEAKTVDTADASNSKVLRTVWTAKELLATEFPPVRWTVPNYLPEGAILLAAAPKIGKTWLALGFGIAISLGTRALGVVPVQQGTVLYLGLEDGARRFRGRLEKLLPHGELPENLHIITAWKPLDRGGLEDLRRWVKAHPDTRLVVVDTLKKIRPRSDARRNIYDTDYEALSPLQALATEFGITVLIDHHTNRSGAADPLDQISGSNGLLGAVDGALVLRRERGQADASLFVTGRDLEDERDQALHFNKELAQWEVLGNAEQYRLTPERQRVLEVMRRAAEPIGPKDVYNELANTDTSVKEGATRKLITMMTQAGQLVNVAHGKYVPAAQFLGEAQA
jgi:hypothetical protein